MSDIYGPNTTQVQAYLDLLPTLTEEQWNAARDATRDAEWEAPLAATWNSEWEAARAAGREEAWTAAWTAAWDAVWNEARDEARVALQAATRGAVVLVARDLISAEHFESLTAPMRAAGVDFDKLGEIS